MSDDKTHPNRTRSKAITLRMTALEYDRFRSQFEAARDDENHPEFAPKTQTDFVLRLLDDRPNSVDFEQVAILAELKRHGNNLNQIARAANSRQGTINPDEVQRTLSALWSLYRRIAGEEEE